MLTRRFNALTERLVGVTAGELASIFAVEVEGGYALRSGHAQGPSGGLVVRAGDSVSVTVARATDPRRNGKPLGWVSWKIENGDATPLLVSTYFDPDRALLRDVEKGLTSLGVSVEITHTPFDEASG